MSIDPISGNSVAANPVHINPQTKADQATAVPQVEQDVKKAAQAAKTDSVTISQQAVDKLLHGREAAAQKAKEKTTEQRKEQPKGQQ